MLLPNQKEKADMKNILIALVCVATLMGNGLALVTLARLLQVELAETGSEHPLVR